MDQLQLIVITLLLACSSSAYCRDHSAPRSEREATGEADESSSSTTHLKDALRTVCRHTTTQLLHDVVPLELGGETEPRWRGARPFGSFYTKPVATNPNSFCAGLKTTCCPPSAEKSIIEVVPRDYREVYHSVLASEYYQSCPSVGRESYHSMRQALLEVRRRLSIDINEALGTTLQSTQSLNNLFDYFTQFTITADLCPLRWNVQQVVEDITLTNVIKGFLDHDGDSVINLESFESAQMNCLRNITSPYIADFTDEISATLQRLLADYKVYVKSLNLLREAIATVKNHQFSDSCSVALMRLKHCAWCGGIAVFPPCLDFCLNTLRGCLADVAELHDDFKELVTAVNFLSEEIDSQLKPDSLLANQLNRFVTMIPEVRQESRLQHLTSRECSLDTGYVNEEDSISSSEPRDRSRRSGFSQTINEERSGTSFNPNVDVSDGSVSKAFSNERKCLIQFEELMMDIPQEMCFLSKSHAITNALNTQCWTGTDIGEYKEPLVGPYKHEQWNNTVFATAPLEPYILFEPLMHKMRLMTTQVNQILEFKKQCVDSDDEDCIRLVDFECENVGIGSGSESGSGSGSGSGLGFVSRYSDLERTKPNTDVDGPTESVSDDHNDPNSEEFSRYNDQGGGRSTEETPPTEETLSTIAIIEITRSNNIPAATTPEIAVTVETQGTVTTLAPSETETTPNTDEMATTTITQETDSEPANTEQQTSHAVDTELEVTEVSTTRASDSTQDDSSAAVSMMWSIGTVTALVVLSLFMN